MAKWYRPVDRDQPFLLPPDMREWLPPDHPVWLVITVVADHLDTSAFHTRRRTGGPGTAGYDPDMLVTVLVWAYAHGVTSSREIEPLCGTDVAFWLICAGDQPDHVTFAGSGRSSRRRSPGCSPRCSSCARLGMGQAGHGGAGRDEDRRVGVEGRQPDRGWPAGHLTSQALDALTATAA